jgi:hypothetical protein
MFAILIPVSLAPVVFTLFWGEWKAKKMGVVKRVTAQVSPTLHRPFTPTNLQTQDDVIKDQNQRPADKIRRPIVNFIRDVDVFGLVLLGCGFALLLIALTLSAGAKGGWNNRRLSLFFYSG